MVTVVPVILQTAGVPEAKLTARPELALALTANGAAFAALPAKAPNTILCGIAARLPDAIWAPANEPAANVNLYRTSKKSGSVRPVREPGDEPLQELVVNGPNVANTFPSMRSSADALVPTPAG